MKAPEHIRSLIRGVYERIDKVPDDESRAFVQMMFARMQQYGDRLMCTFKQRQYLLSLWHQTRTAKEKTAKPKSGLDQLRARRDKITNKHRKSRKKTKRAADMAVAGIHMALKSTREDAVTAKTRHKRSQCRQFTKNRLLIKGSKRD